MPKQIFVVIRFSILSTRKNSWRLGRNRNLQEVREKLFDTRRLETKFRLFETLTLPSLQQQTNKDFTVVVVTSKHLPDAWRERLHGLRSQFPGRLIISEVDVGDFIEQIHSIVGNLIDPAAQLIATARLDDDDALNPSFVKRVDQSMIPDRGNRVITFPNGCYVRLVPEIAVQRIRYPLVAAGLTYVCSPDRFQTIYDLGSHEDVGGQNEVFEDTSPWMYAMSADPSCDTGRELKTPDASQRNDFLREYSFLSD